MALRLDILVTPIDKTIVTTAAKPSGIAATASEIAVMNESQRMIYVACSRAAQFLALAVPKSIADDKIWSVLNGIDIDIRNVDHKG